jgi:hypothetical protein
MPYLREQLPQMLQCRYAVPTAERAVGQARDLQREGGGPGREYGHSVGTHLAEGCSLKGSDGANAVFDLWPYTCFVSERRGKTLISGARCSNIRRRFELKS